MILILTTPLETNYSSETGNSSEYKSGVSKNFLNLICLLALTFKNRANRRITRLGWKICLSRQMTRQLDNSSRGIIVSSIHSANIREFINGFPVISIVST